MLCSDPVANDILKFFFGALVLCFLCGFGIAACEATFESPNERISSRKHTETLMKICVEAKMDWREGNCVGRE